MATTMNNNSNNNAYQTSVILTGLIATVLLFSITFRHRQQQQKQRPRPPNVEQESSSSTSPYRHTTLYRRGQKIKSGDGGSGGASRYKPKHALLDSIIPAQELDAAFREGVLRYFQETKLPSYSRYEDWRQSCYMEIHPKWTPQPEVNIPLLEKMAHIQEHCRQVFARWYCELYSLDEVEIITLNSFVTKYVAEPSKNEFGKHVDGIKVQGSLVLALPTDEENDWPGMLVWDGAKGRGCVNDDSRPRHHYMMQPGDALVLDRMVWHHGLPITTGKRYVVVNFYSCQWKKISNTEGL